MRQTRGLRSTPKVFNSNYRPPKQFNWQAVRSLLPALWVVIIVTGFMLLTRLPLFRIADIQITGTDKPNIVATINELKGQSIFSRNVGNVERTLPNQDFSIKSIKCNRGLPSTLKCQVALRTPAMVWKTNNEQYLLDADGVVYTKVDPSSSADTTNLTLVEDKRNLQVTMGETIVNQDILSSMTKARELFSAKGYNVGSLAVDEAFYQFTLNLTGANEGVAFAPITPLPVLMSSAYSIESQVSAAQELLNTKAGTIKQQIDLRVQGYAYIK